MNVDLPLVTVITPTDPLGGRRHGLLIDRCIPSVQAQTYPAIEHIIVSDGPDIELDVKLKGAAALGQIKRSYIYEQLSADERGGRWGVKPRLRGLELATGDYIAYLDDDDAYREHHIATLVGALEAHPEDGFAYSKMASHGGVDESPGGSIVGSPELGPCLIGSPMIMHRRELTKIATWGPPNDMEDWRLVDRWLQHGVTARFVDWVTVDAYPSTYREVWGS